MNIFRRSCVKLIGGLDNFKGLCARKCMVSHELSLQLRPTKIIRWLYPAVAERFVSQVVPWPAITKVGIKGKPWNEVPHPWGVNLTSPDVWSALGPVSQLGVSYLRGVQLKLNNRPFFQKQKLLSKLQFPWNIKEWNNNSQWSRMIIQYSI